MPPHATLNRLLCVPARYTTKNKHLHPGALPAWPRDFHGGRFGVSGTPPTKPFNCNRGVGIVRPRQDCSASGASIT